MANQMDDVLPHTVPSTELSSARTELFESFALLPDLVRAVARLWTRMSEQALLLVKMVAEIIDPVMRPLETNWTELQLCTIETTNIRGMNFRLVMDPSIG